jgi:hypothetical protein
MRGLFLPCLSLGALLSAAPQQTPLVLELRIFNGTAEVTSQTRVAVHRAGDRTQPVAQIAGSPNGIVLDVPEGIYDVQAVEERDGQVINIQWANRLVVMPYPDEAGRHLEVLNFRTGFGALQVRAPDDVLAAIALHAPGSVKEVGSAIKGQGYVLFVVPAGTYDISTRRGDRRVRHPDVEVPPDRTRLWMVPDE